MKKTIWLLLDNRIGSKNQALGIAHYLDENKFNIIIKNIEYNKLASLPNFIRQNTLLGITKSSKELLKSPFPDFVLSSTRRTAPVARYIKKQNPATKLFQLIHIGRSGLNDFELVFVPEHDKHKIKSNNIRYTVGAPHFITQEKLDDAKQKWQNKFSHLPRPITALIVGGAIKKHPFSIENAKKLALAVKKLKEKEGGSLLITTSRRTGLDAQNEIMSILGDFPNYNYLWGSKDENPYLGFLSCSDNIVVTGDSVSMCCEATATHKPLRIFTATDWLTPKHLSFVKSLYDYGYAQNIENEHFSTTHLKSNLNVAKDIAEIISNLCH